MALSSESDCSLSEDPPVASPVTMVTTQVDPAAVYQVVYDLSGLGTVKPEPGQENMISIELGEFYMCLWRGLTLVPAGEKNHLSVKHGDTHAGVYIS